VLFEAIRAGRITASELGPTFGRVGPRAAQLGLSLEETAGALAAITVRGVKTSEAITALGGILTALTKPTDSMAATLNKLGFSSGEAAVATLKLPGLLQALADSTDGSNSSLAKLFPNLRGISGQLALTGKGLKEFVADLNSMEAAGANLAESKYLQATASDAERVTKELNKIKTALTVDLGQSVLKAGADLSQFIGGADNLVSVAKAAGPALLGLGAGFIALRGSIAASRAELTGLSRGLGLLALAPVAYGVGSSIGNFIGGKMADTAFDNLRQLEDSNAKSLEAFKQQQSEKRDLANKADDARVQNTLRKIQQLNKLYLSEVDTAKRASDAVVKNAEVGLQKYLTTRERLVAEFAKGIAQSQEAIKSSQERITSLTERQGERDFSRSLLGMGDTEKVEKMLSRASDLADEGAKALSKAITPDQISAALKTFDRAQSTGERAEGLADSDTKIKAARTLEDITNRQLV